MSIVEHEIEPLVAGDKLSREEFLRRWEAMPWVKKAELIGGIVYMPSPVSYEHGSIDGMVSYWLGHYALHTPGCETGNNTTWYMRKDAPQPDVYLRIIPDCGGQSGIEDGFGSGAPELAAEVCFSSTAYDLHQKKDLYEAAGVKEYVAVLLREQEVRWHRLVGKSYELLPVPSDGVYRSVIFPGLWLDAQALVHGQMKQVLETLDRGLQSPEHAEFVKELAHRSGR